MNQTKFLMLLPETWCFTDLFLVSNLIMTLTKIILQYCNGSGKVNIRWVNSLWPGKVTPYANIDLGQHWLRYHIGLWPDGIKPLLDLVDLSSRVFHGIHLRAISQKHVFEDYSQGSNWSCPHHQNTHCFRKGTYICLMKSLTLNVRGPSYLGLTRSISWLLMP